jgi:hypothetical protein
VARECALPNYRHCCQNIGTCLNPNPPPENPARCMKYSTYSVLVPLVTGLLPVLVASVP